MIQALTHFLYEGCPFIHKAFSDVSYKEFLFLFLVHSFVINHGLENGTGCQFIEVNENGKRFVDD